VRHTHLLAIAASLALYSCIPRVSYSVPGVAVVPFGASVQNVAGRFARTFCGTLTHLDPNHTEWGSCTGYLKSALADEPQFNTPIPTNLTVLAIGGIFSHCFDSRGVHAFGPALKHLKDDHHLATDTIEIDGLGTPEDNAARIDAYLRQHQGQYIAVGHSKGAVDLMTAIQLYESAKTQIAALVSVAGAIAGSRLMDYPMPVAKVGFQEAALRSGLGQCPIESYDGMKSVRREVRYAFLTRWSPPVSLRSFSLVGAVPEKKTSTVLRRMWRRLEYYSSDQDSQVIAEEGIIPNAEFLGVAKGDHWALALPFTEHHDEKIRTSVSENRFPRTALLEAIVRYVHGQVPRP
jgi:hypothetical protein